MKTIIIVVLALAAASVASPASANTCLRIRDIVSSHSEDGRTLVFKMRNGQTLVNHLQGVCSDLRFNGYVWTIRGTEVVCENTQSLQVLHSGQVCVLGKFDPAINKQAPR